MKVVVYLPALNEAETIGAVLDGIPARLPGVESIRTIVVDDGSTDATGAIAQRHGATVVRHRRNLGTGRTFVSGVSAALRAGADIIVSMDADGQFRGEDVARLIAPIREGRADIALCSRFADGNLVGEMSWPKKASSAASRPSPNSPTSLPVPVFSLPPPSKPLFMLAAKSSAPSAISSTASPAP